MSTIAIFFVIGVYKGFMSSMFSFISGWVVVFVAYLLCGKFANFLQSMSLFSKTIPDFLEKNINSIIQGKFSSVEEMKNAVGGISGMVMLVIMNFAGNLQIDGEMTAGKILKPSITKVLTKMFSFIILFIMLSISLFFIKKILSKVAKLPFISGQNRLLGGAVGIVRGIFIFLIFYGAFTSVGSLFFSEKLISVSKNGVLSSKIYEFITKKIINLFYQS